MGTRTKILITLAFAGTCGALALPSAAGAAARSGVTLKAPDGGFKGWVFSTKPGKCADGRTVTLFKEKGKKPNPKRDVNVYQTQAFKQNGKYKWLSTGYDFHRGHFYARVPATPACQADNSKTVHISARPKTKITGIEERGHGAHYRVDIGFDACCSFPDYRYRTKLDHQSWQHHRYPQKATYRHLSAGDHIFKVYAIGSNGKRDLTPAKLRFHVNRHGHVTS
jgi:hypothetical protein